jgi:hypothetical protein
MVGLLMYCNRRGGAMERYHDTLAFITLLEAVSKCFPLAAGFKIKEGDPDMSGLTTPLKTSGTGIHTLKISRIYPPQAD